MRTSIMTVIKIFMMVAAHKEIKGLHRIIKLRLLVEDIHNLTMNLIKKMISRMRMSTMKMMLIILIMMMILRMKRATNLMIILRVSPQLMLIETIKQQVNTISIKT